MKCKFTLSIIIFCAIFLSGCRCGACEPPPPYLAFRIIDKNTNDDLLYTKKYLTDSIQVYYLENNLKFRIGLDFITDTVNKQVILGSSDWIKKSVEGKKIFFLKLDSSDIDTVLLDAALTGDDCCSSPHINLFTINRVKLSESAGSDGLYRK